jgi:hypothetical protein
VPWYRSLSKSQWSTLVAANLGWMFDGYETYAVLLSVGIRFSGARAGMPERSPKRST